MGVEGATDHVVTRLGSRWAVLGGMRRTLDRRPDPWIRGLAMRHGGRVDHGRVLGDVPAALRELLDETLGIKRASTCRDDLDEACRGFTRPDRSGVWRSTRR